MEICFMFQVGRHRTHDLLGCAKAKSSLDLLQEHGGQEDTPATKKMAWFT